MHIHVSIFFIVLWSVTAIWPQPVEWSVGTQVLWLGHAPEVTLRCDEKSFTLRTRGLQRLIHSLVSFMDNVFRPPQAFWGLFQTLSDIEGWHGGNNNFSENYILHKAAFEAMNSMQNSKFVPWKLHERNELFEPLPDAPRHELSALQIQLSSCPAKSTFNPDTFFDGDESYELVMTNETAILRSNSTLGSLRGLQTFSQLFYAHSSTSGVYTPYVPLQIADRPRWRHRGLSIDVARNPFKPQDLIRTIKAMAATKMSRLHVHATDSQSWPLEIPSLPELARKGAYRPDLVWTAEDLRDIQLYGASKGISVFVEIDMPGHTASVAHAFPALIAAFNELDWSTFAAEPLSGQLKLNLSAVHDFLEDVLTDLLPRTRPYTSFYHIGGDEVNIPTYLLDDTVRSDDPSVLQPLLQRFIDHAIVLSTKHGLQPIVWEEMILDWNLTLPLVNGTSDGALVQVWRDSSRIEEVLKKGHRVIFGDFKHWYLDCGFGGFLDPYPTGKSPPGVPVNTTGGRPSKLTSPYLDYCAPYHNWRQMYTYDPLANISADLIAGVEGGEVLMWSEQTDSFDLDSKLWPRVASAAEVLWSGTRQDELMEDATRRLGEWRERGIIDLGINMTPVAMTWCLMNRGRCNL